MKKQTIFYVLAMCGVLAAVFVAGAYFAGPKKADNPKVENVVSITQGVEVVQTDTAGWVLRETNVIRLEKLNLQGRIAEVKKLIADQVMAIEQATQIKANAQKQLEILQKIQSETDER